MQEDSAELLRLFIDQAPVPIAMFDREMLYIAASRRWVTDYGFGQRKWRGISHYELFPEIPDRWRAIHQRALSGEIVAASEDRFDRADGSVQFLRWEVRPWYREKVQGGVIIFTEDVTERKNSEAAIREINLELEQRVHARTAQLEEMVDKLQTALIEAESLRRELREQAIRDPLTGLFNRRFMEESMNQEVARAHRGSTNLAVVMLDIDKFKLLNDTHGHEAGDAALRGVARLLMDNVRASDVVCRFGGDEFIILMPGASFSAAMRKAKRLNMQLKIQRVACSTGVAIYPDHGSTAQELIMSADAALYRAKAAGGARVAEG
jgi:diguanylate cyclase (GGDEF)-like protein/PAS domain S-box-containing protein